MVRIDKGKKRKTYAGKPVKKRKTNSSYVPYRSDRDNDAPLKVQFVQRVPMSLDGFRSWNKKIRPKVNRTVFKAFPSISLTPEQLSTPESIEDIAVEHLQGVGTWDLRLLCTKKNKGHVSFCRRATIKIRDTEEGLVAKLSDYHLLSRYFFWRGG